MNPKSIYERVENCNYARRREEAEDEGRRHGGKDIAEGSIKLTLAVAGS